MATTKAPAATGTARRTMTAARIHEHGGPEVVRLDGDVPVPTPGPGEVLVRVAAAGVNPLDRRVRDGFMRQFVQHPLPLVLGWDLAGTVEQVGEGVDGLAAGDRVFGRLGTVRGGAFAEYAVVPQRELAAAPASCDLVTAAALPLAGTTALQALVSMAGVSAGQRVLVHGAAGGVGHLAVQLARSLGAEVVATALPGDVEFVRGLGVNTVVPAGDATAADLRAAALDGYDAVLDPLGGPATTEALDLLRPGGALVSTVAFPDPAELAARGLRGGFLDNDADTVRLRALADLVDAGTLRVHVHEVLPLADVRRALDLASSGGVRGKLVLVP